MGQLDSRFAPYIQYRCLVGSHAYGLATGGSDYDYRGFYVPPATLHWSLNGVPEQIEDKEGDQVFWEVEKFLRLALKANPTILECLFTDQIAFSSPLADKLLSIRDAFISRRIADTYSGYAKAQYRLIEKRLADGLPINWKHAMHLLRLLIAGTHALYTGRVLVHVGSLAPDLLAVKQGKRTWEEVQQWHTFEQRAFEAALERTTLPAVPDEERANALLLEVRRSAV